MNFCLFYSSKMAIQVLHMYKNVQIIFFIIVIFQHPAHSVDKKTSNFFQLYASYKRCLSSIEDQTLSDKIK